jgi:hypothetical protein
MRTGSQRARDFDSEAQLPWAARGDRIPDVDDFPGRSELLTPYYILAGTLRPGGTPFKQRCIDRREDPRRAFNDRDSRPL